MKSENFPTYYQPYIEQIPDGEPTYLLEEGLKETIRILALVSEDAASQSYKPGKWSIKDILQHLIDTERIFCFRALSFARGELQKINGYEHDDYAKEAQANNRSLKGLLEEFRLLRQSTVKLFQSFDKTMMERSGNANNLSMTVEQIQCIIIGHEIHHRTIIEERYLA